jgi:hypothetical protein
LTCMTIQYHMTHQISSKKEFFFFQMNALIS